MRILFALALSACLSLPAVAGRHKVPDTVEDALAFALTDRAKAIKLLEGELAGDPESAVLHLFVGEQYRIAGKSDEARKHFLKASELAPESWEHESATLGIALLNKPDSQTFTVLENVSHKDAIDTQNAYRYTLLALQAAKADDAKAAGSYSRKALSYAKEDPTVLDLVTTRLERVAQGDKPGKTDEEGDKPDASDAPPLERAEAALADGKIDKARDLTERALEEDLSEDDELAARYLLKRLDAAPVDPDKIAVLLPTTGKYEAVGKQIRQALELGYGKGGRTLEYIDTGSTPEGAVAAVEKAALEHGAVAIVGPVLTPESGPAARTAQALRIPLISLAAGLDVGEDQDWVMQPMASERSQVGALLDFVMNEKGMKTFAIFSPDTDYGQRASIIFKEEAEARGATVVVHQTYEAKATDLIPFAKKLGRKDYSARGWEFKKLKEEAEKLGGNPDTVVLPPIIDFDALFIPDNARRLPLACAALAFEEFPMGEFKTGEKVDTFPILGLSAWNKHTLAVRGGEYVRGAYFADAFLPPPPYIKELKKAWKPDVRTASFSEHYRTNLGRTPTALEAAAYDVGQLLSAAGTDARDRAGLREALLAAEVDDAATGLAGLDPETGSADRQMRILTITKDGVFPVKRQDGGEASGDGGGELEPDPHRQSAQPGQ